MQLAVRAAIVGLLGAALVRCAGLQGGSSRVFRLASQQNPLEEIGDCNCNCCHVSYRPPTLVINGLDVMCSPVLGPDSCGHQCYGDPTDLVLTASVGKKLEYNRYCFFECKPSSNVIGDLCGDLSMEESKKLQLKDGNAADMALHLDFTGIAKAPSGGGGGAAAAAAAPAAAEGPAAPAVDEAALAAMRAASASSAEVAAKEALTAAVEARSAAAEAKSQKAYAVASEALRQSMGAAGDNRQSVAMQLSYQQQVAIHAKSAKRAREATDANLAKIRGLARAAADEAISEAVSMEEGNAADFKGKLAGMQAKFSSPDGHTADSAGTVAGPYNAALGRAKKLRNDLSAKAQSLAATAAQLQVNARVVAAQAQVYQAAGNTGLAASMFAKAKNAMNLAVKMQAEAKKWQAAAAHVQKDLPMYQLAGGTAAARAAALDQPGYHVPPPMPL